MEGLGIGIVAALDLVKSFMDGASRGVTALMVAGIAAGATLLAAVVTIAFTIVWDVIGKSPTFQTLFAWIGYIYFWGGVMFSGLEIGLDFSRLRTKLGWIVSVLNVVLWPIMWPGRCLLASKVKSDYDQLLKQSGGDPQVALDALRDVDACSWYNWLWIPTVVPNEEDPWRPWGETPGPLQRLWDKYKGNDAWTWGDGQVGPINCYIRALVSELFSFDISPSIPERHVHATVKDQLKCSVIDKLQ